MWMKGEGMMWSYSGGCASCRGCGSHTHGTGWHLLASGCSQLRNLKQNNNIFSTRNERKIKFIPRSQEVKNHFKDKHDKLLVADDWMIFSLFCPLYRKLCFNIYIDSLTSRGAIPSWFRCPITNPIIRWRYGGERITSAEVADGLRLLRIHGSGALGFPAAGGS